MMTKLQAHLSSKDEVVVPREKPDCCCLHTLHWARHCAGTFLPTMSLDLRALQNEHYHLHFFSQRAKPSLPRSATQRSLVTVRWEASEIFQSRSWDDIADNSRIYLFPVIPTGTSFWIMSLIQAGRMTHRLSVLTSEAWWLQPTAPREGPGTLSH